MRYGRLRLQFLLERKKASIFFTLITALVGYAITVLLSDQGALRFAFSFIVLFYSGFLILATLVIFNQHTLLEEVRENYELSIHKIFKEHLTESIRSTDNALFNIIEKRPRLGKELKSLSETIKEEDLDVDEAKAKLEGLISEFKGQVNDEFNKALDATCNNVSELAQHHLTTRGITNVNINSCVKLLETPYFKPNNDDDGFKARYETDISNLKVRSVYRDKRSEYKVGREINELTYTVEGNDAFRDCLIEEKPETAIFRKDRLKKAYESKFYKNENERFHEFYNSTSCIPFFRKIKNKGTIYYGFLTIDCMPKDNRLVFEEDDCKFILESYAKLLALVYYYIDNKYLDIYHKLDNI